jgi:DNA-binding response OmpR family regulator
VLLRDVWGLRSIETRTVDVHIRKLRQKLGDAVAIDTVRGVGYRLDVMKNEAPR